MYDYEKTCKRFLEVNCKITDTKEEYEDRNKDKRFSKCNKRITKKLDTINSIIIDKTPNIVQTPISLYKKDGYYITVNIRGCISFLYEIRFENLFDFLTIDKPVGFYENYIKNLSL